MHHLYVLYFTDAIDQNVFKILLEIAFRAITSNKHII